MDHLNNIQLPLEGTKSWGIEKSGGAWSLNRDHVENWAWGSDYFNDDEINTVCQIGSSLILDKGSTMDGSTDARDSMVSFIFPNYTTAWLFQRMTDIINDFNLKYFKFDLSSMDQGLQYTEYKAPGQHYSWHIDKGMGIRKLSVVVQLSDPAEYEGGELQLNLGGDDYVTIEKKKGYITIFPSYVLHRVTPVTSGLRKSLVCWVSGPCFK